MPEQRVPGMVVASPRLSGAIYYLNRDGCSVTLIASPLTFGNEPGTRMSTHLDREIWLDIDPIPRWETREACPVLVRKYVREEDRA